MSGMQRGIVTHDAASQAFDRLETRISEEWDADNLLDLLIRISTLLDLLEEQIGNVQKRLVQ